ncbi:MAG TPA: YihY/virulence factor BrkB family protein [Sphingomicrobium sp.]
MADAAVQHSAATDSNSAKGRDADSPAQIPARGWKEVAVRTWKQSSEDNVGLVAAGVAFYSFLALVPLLGAIVLTYGIVADPQTVVAHVTSLSSVVPEDAAKLIGDQLMSIVETSGGKKGFGLLLAIGVALFGARNAAGSLVTALNIAYEEKETRGFVRVNLLALAITAGAVVVAVIAMFAITALGYLEKLIPGAPDAVLVAGKLLTYVLLLLGAAAAAATLYRYGPNRQKAQWKWITPGTLFAALTWVLLTFGFGFYVSHFGNYNKTYGSLATVVILNTWIYLSAYVFLFGAELNSELEHQTAKDTTAGPPDPLGRRQAWSADHVASGDDDESGSGRDAGPHQDETSVSPPRDHDQPQRTSEPATGTDAGPTQSSKGEVIAGVAVAAAAVGWSMLKRKD